MGWSIQSRARPKQRSTLDSSTDRIQRKSSIRIHQTKARIKAVMIKRILNKLFGQRISKEEKYLAQAVDHIDLDRRLRELDKRQFGGNQFGFLYNRFYL